MKCISLIEAAIEAIAAGGMVIVVDDKDRENEGDFVAAAETITPQMVHFMLQRGCGLLCVPVLPEVATRLRLAQMVQNTEQEIPKFTIPVDHLSCRSGVSPWERRHTIHQIINPRSEPDDFLRPGHVFPLVANPNGVLARPGHTEAAVDLARLAGLTPAGVLCEICSSQGLHMADRSELVELSCEIGAPLISIDDLIAWRREHERPGRVEPGRACNASTGNPAG